MAIQNLPEFAKNGQKNTDGLVLLDGFPVNKKPARQWFNFLFNQLTVAINAINAEKLDATSNAVSASKWQTARTVSFSGAATGSFSVDGSENSSCVLTLANSGVAASTYGSTIDIPVLTIDAKGLIKVATTQTIRSASTTQTGVTQLNNTLTSTSTSQSLTAAQGKALNDQDFGVGQQYSDMTSQRALNTTYTNTTKKPIEVSIYIGDHSNQSVQTVSIFVDNFAVINAAKFDGGSNFGCFTHSFSVPVGSTYMITKDGFGVLNWSELR